MYLIHIQGAKLFYLSGLIHGQYPKTEVHNLARFISVMKLPPLEWRGSHPYVLTDRMEDLTDPEERRQNVKCDRTVSLYGYARGTHLKPNSAVHIPGDLWACLDNLLPFCLLPYQPLLQFVHEYTEWQ